MENLGHFLKNFHKKQKCDLKNKRHKSPKNTTDQKITNIKNPRKKCQEK